MTDKKQNAEEWLTLVAFYPENSSSIDDSEENSSMIVNLSQAKKALLMAREEGRQECVATHATLCEKQTKQAEENASRKAAKEIFAELEKIVPCGTCKGEHSCYCSIETQDESKHLPNCEIKDWCIDIESLKAKWVKEE